MSAWRGDRMVLRWTKEVLSLQTSACEIMSDRLVAIGQKLHAVRERLVHGEWMDWLDVAVPFDPVTANRYIGLAAFAREDPSEYRRLRHLGPGKLYVIVKVPPERRRRLQLGRPLPIPGSGRKTVEIMTPTELGQHLRDLALPPGAEKEIEVLVQDYRFRIGALSAATMELAKRSDEVDVSVARELHGTLTEVSSALREAFGL